MPERRTSGLVESQRTGASPGKTGSSRLAESARPQGVARAPARGSTSPGHDPAFVGSVIRKARVGRFSIRELSEVAGVSVGLISQVERGQGNPSIATLTRLAYALDLSIGSFFDLEDQSGQRGGIVRSDHRKTLVLAGSSLTYQLLTPDLEGSLGVVRTVIAPKFDNRDAPFQHPGTECVHILRGTLRVALADDTLILYSGDSITYDSSTPHAWINEQDAEVEVIAAMTPPSF